MNLTEFQLWLFNGVNLLIYVLYVVIIFGQIPNAVLWLNELQYYVKIYVSMFLIMRFNPYRSVPFTELDKQIVFSAGIFLLLTTALSSLLTRYIKDIQDWLHNIKKT